MRTLLLPVLTIMALLIKRSTSDFEDVTCPAMCKCYDSKAVCTGNQFTYVPRFPNDILEISISNSNLHEIREDGLFNLTFNTVLGITFRNNGIKYIHPFAFQNVTNITKFEISDEKEITVETVKSVFKNMKTRYIRRLQLFNNGWSYIPHDMFDSFTKTNLKQLYLYGNNFQLINGSIFSKLKKLEHLDVHGNQISSITTQGLTKLKELNLQHNSFEAIPKLCHEHGNIFSFPNLKILNLGFNSITQVTNVQCLPKLTTLSLQNNLVDILHGNAFSNLPNLLTLNLLGVGKRVHKVEPNAFNITSLISLTISDCKFQFNKFSLISLSKMFVNMPKLKVLNLGQNVLPSDYHSLKLLFNPLTKLKKLHLNSCRLFQFPLDVLSRLTNLQQLSLRGNKIQSLALSEEVKVNLSKLEYLDLEGNRFNIVNTSSIPFSMLPSLKRISLGNNPYYCVCEQMWFVNWLRSTNITLEEYPEQYKCVQPLNMKHKLLKYYKPTAESCTPWNPIITIVLSVSVLGVLVLLLVFLIIKCQTNIKNYIYLLRVSSYRKLGYLPIKGDEDFEYHAFIVYCDSDRKWVHDRFVRKLETEEGLRLCIHHRDFEVGETITGNIDNFLRKSWKVVVIISNEFAKSEWCQWEVDIVQERRRRLGRDVFLLIMLKDVTTKFMTSSLRTLLDSTSFLRYKQGVGEELFWRAAIKGLTKPVGNPPVSVFN